MPPVGDLELALARAVGVGERAALVAEQLALEQRLGDRAAVDRHERPARAARLASWIACATSSLPVPFSPSDQHGGVGRRHALDQREHLADRLGLADQPVVALAAADARPAAVPARCCRTCNARRRMTSQLVELDRLRVPVHRAAADREQRVLAAVVAGHHDHLGERVAVDDLVEQVRGPRPRPARRLSATSSVTSPGVSRAAAARLLGGARGRAPRTRRPAPSAAGCGSTPRRRRSGSSRLSPAHHAPPRATSARRAHPPGAAPSAEAARVRRSVHRQAHAERRARARAGCSTAMRAAVRLDDACGTAPARRRARSSWWSRTAGTARVRMNSSLMPRPVSRTVSTSVARRRRPPARRVARERRSSPRAGERLARVGEQVDEHAQHQPAVHASPARRRARRPCSRTPSRSPSASPRRRRAPPRAASRTSARLGLRRRAGAPRPTTWLISSRRFVTVRSTTAIASRWNSGFARCRRAFSTTSDSPETWFLMSCSTKRRQPVERLELAGLGQLLGLAREPQRRRELARHRAEELDVLVRVVLVAALLRQPQQPDQQVARP